MTKRIQHILSNPLCLAYGILLLAFLVRLLYWSDQWFAPLIVYGDEGNYYGGALDLAHGTLNFWRSEAWHRWFDLWLLPPLYTVWLAGLVKLLGESILALRLFQVLVGTFTVALVYRLGRTLFDARIGAGAALLAALYWPLVALPVLLMTEALYIPLLIGAFVLLVEFAKRGSYVRLGAAGLLLALATLTRAIPTLFFAVVLLWLLGLKRFRWRAALVPALVFLVGAGLVFAPWVLRNYALHQRLLLTDTMGAYNLGLVTRALNTPVANIKNPVDRQSVIVRASLENLAAHPDVMLTRIGPNTLHLLRLEALYRLVGNNALDSLAEFTRNLILDDGIFLMTVLLSICGFIYAREWPLRSLMLLWLGYSLVLLIFIYFSQVRFRWPVLPLLMPHAAYGLQQLQRRAFKSARPWQNALAFGLCALVLILSGGAYPARLVQVAARNVELANATSAVQRGQWDAATRNLDQAQSIEPRSPYVEMAWGDFYRASGDTPRAVAAYERTLKLNPESLAARFRLANLQRAAGQDKIAAQLFDDQGEYGPELMEWAWAHPEVLASRPDHVDVGGEDIGYVRWMHPRQAIQADEQDWTFRWTQRLGQVRLFPPAQASVLSVHLSGWRPEGVPRSTVIIRIDDREVTRLLAPRTWRIYNFPLPWALPPGQPVVVTFQTTNPFTEGGGVLQPQFGMQLDWVQLGTKNIGE